MKQTQIQMICLDIDGTLLDSKNRLSAANKEAVRAAAARGIQVVLVTARPPKGVFYLMEELGLAGPAVCFGGGLVLEDGHPLLSHTLPLGPARETWMEAAERGIHTSLYGLGGWFVEKMDDWAVQEGGIVHHLPEVTPFDALFARFQREEAAPHKALCMGDPARIDQLRQALLPRFSETLSVCTSKLTYLEIVPRAASKTGAISFLCDRYGVAMEQVMALGDQFNDLDLLLNAGLGVAMGNAPEAVKKQADDITLANDQDGVAAALKKYLF